MTPEEHKPEIIGSLDLWVDNSRFDQTEMIVVGDKQFIRKDKVMSMLQKWDEHNKPARAEELKAHAVEFATHCNETFTPRYSRNGKLLYWLSRERHERHFTTEQLYHNLFNPKP